MVESNRDEIAKLEALYAANPEGRVFTHLAEAYRKAGRLDQAREILDAGLTRHTDYPSAHVVLGRVLLDAHETDGAGHAFRRVLELDRHNLIALRALGEIARANGRTAEALHYYQELSVLDPGNDELSRIVRDLEAEAARAGEEAPIGAGWSSGAVDTAFEEEPSGAFDRAPGEGSPDETPAAAEAGFGPLEGLEGSLQEEVPAEIETIGVESSADSAGFAEEEVPAWAWGGGEPSDEVEVDNPPEPADDEDVTYGLTSSAFDGFTIVPETTSDEARDEGAEPQPAGSEPGEWVPQERWDTFTDPAAEQAEPPAAQADWEREPAGEPLGETDTEAFDTSPVEGLESDTGWSETNDLDTAADLELDAETDLEFDDEFGEDKEIGLILEVESVETVRIDIDLDPETANAIVAENLPDYEEEDSSVWRAPAEVVTETMAEVYAAQGLTERAVDVYRQLRQLRPDDDRIEARLAELEEAMRTPAPAESRDAEDREAWLEKVESAWTGGEGAVGSDDDSLYGWHADAEDGDDADARPVGTYFRTLLSWRPPGWSVEAGEPEAEPPSAGAFLDESPEGTAESMGGEEELLLVDEIESPSSADAPAAGGSVEAAFDEWFGPTPGSAEAETSSGSAGAPLESGDSTESEEDLEMFRTWLQSLKK
jgi:tetratricopeptide (TPR) repeat protein